VEVAEELTEPRNNYVSVPSALCFLSVNNFNLMTHIGMLHIIRQANAYNIVRSVPLATQKTPRTDKNAANVDRTAAMFS
jgi:hypothetical protein